MQRKKKSFINWFYLCGWAITYMCLLHVWERKTTVDMSLTKKIRISIDKDRFMYPHHHRNGKNNILHIGGKQKEKKSGKHQWFSCFSRHMYIWSCIPYLSAVIYITWSNIFKTHYVVIFLLHQQYISYSDLYELICTELL